MDTIGGGCIESEVIRKALLMMRAEDEGFRLCTVDMTADAAEDEAWSAAAWWKLCWRKCEP